MTKRAGIHTLILCLVAPVLAHAADSDAWSGSVAKKNVRQHVEQLDKIFEKTRLDARAPGLVYGVVAGGELVHWRGFGVRALETKEPVTVSTIFRIASMTKMMTAQLVGDLQAQQKLFLDAPAEIYAPELKDWSYPTIDSRKVTVRDLLNHTAGFVTDNPWADRQMALTQSELDEVLKNAEPFSYAPGEGWAYSNLGFVVAGRIIENVTGQTFAERLNEKILTPLRMTDSGLDLGDAYDDRKAAGYKWLDNAFVDEPVLGSGAFDPLGGLWTTAADYGRYLAWVLSAWPARDGADDGAIPRHVIRSVTDGVHMFDAGTTPGNSGSACSVGSGYAMGLSIVRHCTLGLALSHGGGFPGYGSYVVIAPDRDVAVFVFANQTYARLRGAAWDAIFLLDEAGFGRPGDKPDADQRMTDAYKHIGAAYENGSLDGVGLTFSDNFFLDRSPERWRGQLQTIKASVGGCDMPPLHSTGRLSGDFYWQCANGRVAGHIIMSPLDPSDIQELHLREVKISPRGNEIIMDVDFH